MSFLTIAFTVLFYAATAILVVGLARKFIREAIDKPLDREVLELGRHGTRIQA